MSRFPSLLSRAFSSLSTWAFPTPPAPALSSVWVCGGKAHPPAAPPPPGVPVVWAFYGDEVFCHTVREGGDSVADRLEARTDLHITRSGGSLCCLPKALVENMVGEWTLGIAVGETQDAALAAARRLLAPFCGWRASLRHPLLREWLCGVMYRRLRLPVLGVSLLLLLGNHAVSTRLDRRAATLHAQLREAQSQGRVARQHNQSQAQLEKEFLAKALPPSARLADQVACRVSPQIRLRLLQVGQGGVRVRGESSSVAAVLSFSSRLREVFGDVSLQAMEVPKGKETWQFEFLAKP